MSENSTRSHDGGGALGDQFDHLLAVPAWGDLLAVAEGAVRTEAEQQRLPESDPGESVAPDQSGAGDTAPRVVADLMGTAIEPLSEHDLLALWRGIPAAHRSAPDPAPGTPEPVYDPEDELHTGSVDGDRPTRPDLLPVREDIRRTLHRVVEQLVAVSG